MSLFKSIISIIFPSYCISCGKREKDLCEKCIMLCPPAERESANWIYPLFDYRHIPIKKSIWLLKFKNRKTIAKVFAEELHGKIAEELSELSVLKNFRDPILVPVPLSRKRLKERGYNQAELIAEELIKLDSVLPKENRINLKLEKNTLKKVKETEHQTNIKNRKERLKNLSGSFSVQNNELISSRNIILIDDVLTTGATLSEAKKVLRENGARKVIAFTVAH